MVKVTKQDYLYNTKNNLQYFQYNNFYLIVNNKYPQFKQRTCIIFLNKCARFVEVKLGLISVIFNLELLSNLPLIIQNKIYD